MRWLWWYGAQARVHQNQCEFIALQALEHEQQFFLWTRSGTIGYTGKTLLVGPYESEERVVVEFCNTFSAKTSCTWEERHSLEYQDGWCVRSFIAPTAVRSHSLTRDLCACVCAHVFLPWGMVRSTTSYTWIELDHSMGTPYTDLSSPHNDTEYDETAPRGQKRRRTSSASKSTSTTTSSRLYNFVQDWSGAASPLATKQQQLRDATARPASRLHAEVQAFMNLIADPNECLGYSYSETEEVMEEAQKMPLGRLSKTTIKRVRMS